MLLTYNVIPEHQDDYLNFMMNTFVPTVQHMGLASGGVWHTAYGDYPTRLIVFVADDPETMDRLLAGTTWRDLEARLEQYVGDYARRIVPFETGFQF